MTRKEVRAMRAVIGILSLDPVEAMESAKAIVSLSSAASAKLLIEIASSGSYARSSRIAAMVALGLSNFKPASETLIRILIDDQESSQIREHAAEALGNLKSKESVPTLRRLLRLPRKSPIRRSCVYALSQIMD